MIELEESRGEDGLCALFAWGHVDKADFIEVCTHWLWENGYWPLRPGMPKAIVDMAMRLQPELLATPEPEHIRHVRWVLVPGCVFEDGYRCQDDCDCDEVYDEVETGGEPVTIWGAREACQRYRRAKEERLTKHLGHDITIDGFGRLYRTVRVLDLGICEEFTGSITDAYEYGHRLIDRHVAQHGHRPAEKPPMTDEERAATRDEAFGRF